jgi:hypothetical protein
VLSRRSFVALLLAGSLVLPVIAQEKKDKDKKPDNKNTAAAASGSSGAVDLKWKFTDKPYYQEITTTTDQNMTVMGMKINQKQTQTFYFSWKLKSKDGDKLVVTQTIDGVKMDIQIGNNPIQFDSTNPGATANTPLNEFFKALIGSSFTLTLNPKNEQSPVEKIEGRTEFINKLKNANAGLEPLLNRILSDEALKQMADPVFAVAPNRSVKPGDHWDRNLKLDMGPIGTYDTTYKYTFDGKDKDSNHYKIGETADVKYIPPSSDAAAGQGNLPFKIKKADLKTKEAKGQVLFDNDKGRVANSDLHVKMEGSLTIDINGMSTDVQLDQTQTTTVKTSDTNPVPAPAPKK